MIRAGLIFIVLLFASHPALGQFVVSEEPSKWTTFNTILETAYISVNVADCLSSIDGTQRLGLPEKNWMLPEHPTKQQIIGFISAGAVLHLLVVTNIDEPYRTVFQIVTFAMKLYAVDNNIKLGTRITF